MMFLLLIVAIIVLTIAYFLSQTRRPCNYPPGPSWYPIVGTAPVLRRLSKRLGGQHLGLSKLAEIYGTNVVGLKLGKENVIAVSSYPVVRAVLIGEEYEGRPDGFFLRLRCMGTRRGITITDGSLWKTHRNFVTKHLKNSGYGKLPMDQLIRDEVNDLLRILNANDDKKIKIGSILAVSVLNVLWALISGSRLDRDDLRLKKMLDLLDERAKAFDMSGGTLNQFPWLRFIAPEETGFNVIRRLNSKLRELISVTIEGHYATWTEGRDDDLIYSFIKRMRADDGPDSTFTDDQLIMVCLDLFIGGSQTTSNTLDFAFLAMILHPDHQERVRSRLIDAFGKSEPINYCDRHRVPYVEAVLCEVLRFWHVTPIIGPRRVLKNTVLENYSIPKDTTVLINVYSVHQDKEYWGDPEIFRPERFLDDDGKLINHERFIPFGLGKRRCLGYVLARSCIFTFFSEIVRSYGISEYPGRDKPTGIPRPGITLTPEKYEARFIKL